MHTTYVLTYALRVNFFSYWFILTNAQNWYLDVYNH